MFEDRCMLLSMDVESEEAVTASYVGYKLVEDASQELAVPGRSSHLLSSSMMKMGAMDSSFQSLSRLLNFQTPDHRPILHALLFRLEFLHGLPSLMRLEQDILLL